MLIEGDVQTGTLEGLSPASDITLKTTAGDLKVYGSIITKGTSAGDITIESDKDVDIRGDLNASSLR